MSHGHLIGNNVVASITLSKSSRSSRSLDQLRQRCRRNICCYIGNIENTVFVNSTNITTILRRQCCLDQLGELDGVGLLNYVNSMGVRTGRTGRTGRTRRTGLQLYNRRV